MADSIADTGSPLPLGEGLGEGLRITTKRNYFSCFLIDPSPLPKGEGVKLYKRKIELLLKD
jgi:hypothetical protein